jgi:hypothetical protein
MFRGNLLHSSFLFVTALLLTAAPAAFAQLTGDLQVNVADATNAVVPNAAVTVKNLETGATRTAATGAFGSISISQLAIGDYEITVGHEGFVTAKTRAAVAGGTSNTVAVVLSVATATQQVEISERAEVINTVNAQLQQTTARSTIDSLPTVIGGALVLATASPGVTPVTPNNPFLGLGSYNSNGGRGRANNITVDGATATDISTTGGAALNTVPLDAIKEVNLITNQFTAEFGRNASSQFQIVTISGSNDFHGELFEFFRNSFLNTRDYFDRTGSAVPNINNDRGAMAGGKIRANKLFYFGSYEQQTIRGLGGTRVATVPTPAQVSSAAPIAQQIISQYNVPTSPTGTLTQVAPNTTDLLAYSTRIDWIVTKNDTFFGRVGESASHANSTGNTFIDSNLVQNGASSFNRSWTGTLNETHTFSPTTVNNFMAAFGRSAPVFTPFVNNSGKPEILFNDGTANFGTWSGLPQGRIQNTFQYQDIVTHVRGRHTIKAGFELDRVRANSFFDNNVNGSLTFLSLAQFLQGNAFQYSQDFGNSVRGNRVWNEFFFAQDDWKVTRSLTLNIGFREEVSNGVTEINNILSNLDISKTTTPLGGAGTGPFGAFYTGGSFFKTNWNPGPRFGFAWNPRNGKTVIRGGYGISYDFIFLNPITNGRFLPPFMYTFSLPQGQVGVGANSLANILSGTSAFQQQSAAVVGTFGTAIKNFGNVTYIDPKLKNPQVQQYSFTVERQIGSWLAHIGYSGSRGTYLQRTQLLNFIAPGLYTIPTSLAQQQQEQAAGVFSAVYNGSNASFTTPSNRLDPRFNRVSVVGSSANSGYNSLQISAERRLADWYSLRVAYTWSKSIDDASDVLGVLANDTPNQQDPLNNRNNRAVSQFDVPQRISIAHDFVSNFKGISNPVARHLANGWEFGGIFQAQTGLPVNLFAGTVAGVTDGLLIGFNATTYPQRPDLVGPLNLHFQPNPGSSSNPNLIPNSGLAQPLIGHLGTLGRNVIRANPLIESDMTFGRVFTFPERLSLRLQAQVYNVFNNTTFSFGSSVNNLSSPSTFGYYSGTDTNTRRIALTARLNW